MTHKELSGIAQLLVGLLVCWMFVGEAPAGKLANVFGDGRVEFAPNISAYIAWPILVGYASWVAVIEVMHYLRKPFWALIGVMIGWFAIQLLTSFPAKVVASEDGLEQVYWFRRNKRVQWKDIVEINTGKKLRDITIVGLDGTRIVHNARLADRPRLLLELRRHCGENLPADFPAE